MAFLPVVFKVLFHTKGYKKAGESNYFSLKNMHFSRLLPKKVCPEAFPFIFTSLYTTITRKCISAKNVNECKVINKNKLKCQEGNKCLLDKMRV